MASTGSGDASKDDVLGVTPLGRLKEEPGEPAPDPDVELLDLRLEDTGGAVEEQRSNEELDKLVTDAGRRTERVRTRPRAGNELDELIVSSKRTELDDADAPAGMKLEVAPGPANSAKAPPSAVEGYGHPSERAADAMPIATGSPRRGRGAATTEGYGQPAIKREIRVPLGTGADVTPRYAAGGVEGYGHPVALPAEARAGKKAEPEATEDQPPGDPTVKGGRFAVSVGQEAEPEDEGDVVPGDPTVSGGRIPLAIGKDAESDEAYDGPPGDPTVRGNRYDLRTGREVEREEKKDRVPGDPTVRGGGRLGGSEAARRGPVKPVPNGLEELLGPTAIPGWRDRKKELPPPPPSDEPVPGLELVKPPVLEIVGEPSPEQAKRDVLREQARRRVDFVHQRFEMLKVVRPVYRGAAGPEPAALPRYLAGRVPLANGMLAQVAAARFSDHDPLDSWARILARFDVPARAPRLREALGRLTDGLAPVFAALEEQVLSRPERYDEVDLSARLPTARATREGRIRAVTRGAQVWFVWRDLEDLRPVLREGTRAETAGSRAFTLFADSSGRTRLGRWAGIRRKLHAALPNDPERAAYGLFLAHRVRSAWTAEPDVSALQRAVGAFHRWATGLRKTFESPRSPLERAVLAATGDWAALDPVSAVGTLSKPLVKMGEGRQMPVWRLDPRDADVGPLLAWHSLVETCHGLGIRPWDYLHDVVDAVSAGRLADASRWTPSAWQDRPRG